MRAVGCLLHTISTLQLLLQVTHWPQDEYGHFYDGDSYIILNTYKKPGSDVSYVLKLLKS